MTAVELFPEQARREDAAPKPLGEPTFPFLARSSRPAMAAVREVLDGWFRRYPTDHKRALRAAFHHDFDSSFFELVLHEALRGTCDVTVHPPVDGTEKHPDFLVEPRGADPFLVEATIARDLSDDDRALEARRNRFYDTLNRLAFEERKKIGLYLHELEIHGGSQPSARRVVNHIARMLATRWPEDLVRRHFAEGRVERIPRFRYSDASMDMEYTILPRRGGNQLVLTYPFETRLGGGERAVARSLRRKALRYGNPGCPYMIAVNCVSDWGVEREDVEEALYSTRGGLWARGLNTRVSSVLVCSFGLGNVAKSRSWLFFGPGTDRRHRDTVTGIFQAYSDEGARYVELGSLLGLSPLWPTHHERPA